VVTPRVEVTKHAQENREVLSKAFALTAEADCDWLLAPPHGRAPAQNWRPGRDRRSSWIRSRGRWWR
jgi:hypothetical protein